MAGRGAQRQQSGGPSGGGPRRHGRHAPGQRRMGHHRQLSVGGNGRRRVRRQLLGVHLLLQCSDGESGRGGIGKDKQDKRVLVYLAK